MTDTYSRIVLTVIAAALVALAVQRADTVVPAAHAAETIECRFSNPLEIRRIEGTVAVEVKQGFSQPGTNSSYPLYVQTVQ